MIRRILAALDDSPRAPHVLDKAMEIAVAAGASVRIFQAVSVPQDFPPAAHTSKADALPRFLRDEAEHRVRGMVAAHPCASRVAFEVAVVESHDPADAILSEAERVDADLIVLGSHGYARLDRLLGTTTTRVVSRSKRDVLVAHGPSAHGDVA